MPQCIAKVSYGTAWTAGRKRCANSAVPGESYCRTHLNQEKRRQARKEKESKDALS